MHLQEENKIAKTQLELTLASETSENEIDFLKYVNSKRRYKENIGLIKYLTSKHEEKAKEFNRFLPHFLILMMNLGLLNLSWSMMTKGSNYFPSLVTEIAVEQL